MTLKEIESIVRANFVFDTGDDYKENDSSVPYQWRVSKKKHCYNDQMALIVFCGICWMLGFNDKEIIKYLEVKKERHMILLAKYKQALSAHQAAQTQSIFDDIMPDVNRMIINKSQLVMNGVKSIQPVSYIKLSDFNF